MPPKGPPPAERPPTIDDMHIQDEGEYEELMSPWADLEAGLRVILTHPQRVQEFERRVWQYDRWMQSLLVRDADVGLYLMFQLATSPVVGYSAAHSLVSAALCHLVADNLHLDAAERNSLVHAALTMNLAMTELQDVLAMQQERPTQEQQDAIRVHPVRGAMMLANVGILDELWLDTVGKHHDVTLEQVPLASMSPARRLARILRAVDRYGALISPRKFRAGRSATDSVRAIMGDSPDDTDEVGQALVNTIGLCPPGTFVRLDNEDIAIVMRRSNQPNRPHVAVVADGEGNMLPQPRLHRTTGARGPQIRSALASSLIRIRLSHHLILQLGAYAAQTP